MRKPPNETAKELKASKPSPLQGRGWPSGARSGVGDAADSGSPEVPSAGVPLPPAPSPEGEGEQDRHTPTRTCIVTGRHGARTDLIRLAIGPDGTVAPDVRAKAPGRGAWIGCDRATLEAAQQKGKLRAALQRAFKTASVIVPEDLPAKIADALQRSALDRLGLEAKAGELITGTEKIVDQARKGAVHLLIHAADAAEDGTRRLDQALRSGLDYLADDTPDERPQGLVLPVTRSILSMALGRENVVHAALVAPAAAARAGHALRRWRDFIGRDGSRDDGTTAGPAA